MGLYRNWILSPLPLSPNRSGTHGAPSQTRVTRVVLKPLNSPGICTGTHFHHSGGFGARRSCDTQKTLGNTLRTLQRAKPPEPGSQDDAHGWFTAPDPWVLSQLAVPAAAQRPFVSQPISGGAQPFIAINVRKINGK